MVGLSWETFDTIDPNREYFVMAPYLPRKNYFYIITFFRKVQAIRNQLKTSKGLIGYAMRAQIQGKKAWTVSVWQDEAALKSLVGKDPHAKTMKSFSHQLTGLQEFVSWKISGSALPPNWSSVMKHLEGESS
jgi:hypothetical protein